MIISLDDPCTHHFSPTTPLSLPHIAPADFNSLLGPPDPYAIEFKVVAIEILWRTGQFSKREN